jgi:hypothetical protein
VATVHLLKLVTWPTIALKCEGLPRAHLRFPVVLPSEYIFPWKMDPRLANETACEWSRAGN